MLNKYDGHILVKRERDGKKVISLELDTDPEEIENMKAVRFKVLKKNGAK
jgi:hypothetical protein